MKIFLAQLAAIFRVTCRCRQSFTMSPAVSSMYCTVGQLGFILLTRLETTVVQLDLTSINTTDFKQAESATEHVSGYIHR